MVMNRLLPSSRARRLSIFGRACGWPNRAAHSDAQKRLEMEARSSRARSSGARLASTSCSK
ncbi:hypothetical protein D9M71_275010 [compost metagenome]